MKRTMAFSVIFLLGALAFAQPTPSRGFENPLLNDVVQMTGAGLSDATIVAYVKARRARLDSDLSAEDLIRLRRAGVGETVVRYIAGAAGLDAASGSDNGEVTYDSRDESAYPVEPYFEDGYEPYWYGYGYPYWYAYSPYFSGSFFFVGGRSFHGRHFVRHPPVSRHPSFGRGSFGHGGGRSVGRGGHSPSGRGRR